VDHLSPIESAIDDEGLIFTRDDDDEALRITFKSEGDRYFVVGYRDDTNFVMIGSGWALPSEIDLTAAVAVANALNVRKKFVKTAIWEDERDALFTVELCVENTEEIRPHFGRLLDALRDTAAEFFSAVGNGET
jgi:Putative bacterial sensory transduction regulator